MRAQGEFPHGTKGKMIKSQPGKEVGLERAVRVVGTDCAKVLRQERA